MSGIPEKPLNPSVPKVPPVATALLPDTESAQIPAAGRRREAEATALLPPDGAPAVSATAVLPPALGSLSVQAAVKPLPPEERSSKATRRPAASQAVSVPVVLISAAVLLAIAMVALMTRHDWKRLTKKQATPSTLVEQGLLPEDTARRTPWPSAPMLGAPATGEAAAPVVGAAHQPDQEQTPATEGALDEAGAEQPNQGRQMGDGTGQLSPAENGEQGRGVGYARRRW